MLVEHGVRARLERAAAIHQCPQCPFEDNQKGKLTRHKVGCDKRFRPERIQEPPHDWEPPAKIPKPAVLPHQVKIDCYCEHHTLQVCIKDIIFESNT